VCRASIIVIRLAVAILLIKVVSRRAGGFAQCGFRFCHHRFISAAIVFGVPIACALTILINHLSSSPPPELYGPAQRLPVTDRWLVSSLLLDSHQISSIY
jgi:hypothetical protein